MRKFCLLAFFVLSSLTARAADSGARWIWTTDPTEPQLSVRFFRRAFSLTRVPAQATLTISCKNQYEVLVNDHLVGTGNEYRLPGTFSVEHYLVRGMNVVAVRATHLASGPAGLLAELELGRDFRLVTDRNWIWNKVEVVSWTKPDFEGIGWNAVKEMGPPDSAPFNLKGWPKVEVPRDELGKDAGNFVQGFKVAPGFTLENYASDNETSSVLAMTFDGRGQLLTAAAGAGPTEIRVLEDSHGYCAGQHLFWPGLHCQGLTAIGSNIYAVGNGKLYLLKDENGHASLQEALTEMLGSMSEHGPHAVNLGPDGHFYILLGNESNHKTSNVNTDSPIREENLYWGNLLPIQSSNGFMDGLGPPGCRLLRFDQKGKNAELIACGMRNAYDFAFASSGEIFSFDSDMEWDIGLPWYRPNRTILITPGADFGWRYGSGKWKAWAPDSAPPIFDVGRGSPTGIEAYNHVAFPEEYRDAVFLCDWSRGRVLVMFPKREGAGWKSEPVEFVAAKGPNFPVTCCRVGPDGALYFGYGGRGAKGGVYRVRYIGDKPMGSVFKSAELQGIPQAVATALNQPQPQSPYGRAAISRLKPLIGQQWNVILTAAIRDRNRAAAVRSRALDLLGMDGEPIDVNLLQDLIGDPVPLIRALAIQKAALNNGSVPPALLSAALKDSDPFILRRACETMLYASTARTASPEIVQTVIALLGHSDRLVRYAAGNALLRLPIEMWADQATKTGSTLGQATGLLTYARSFQALKPDAAKIMPHFEKLVRAEVALLTPQSTPDETIALLRAIGLTLLANQDNSALPPEIKTQLVERCAALMKSLDDPRLSMDAGELLGFLGDARGIPPLLAKLKNDLLPRDERIHYATAISAVGEGWTAQYTADVLEVLAGPGAGENGVAFVNNLVQSAARLGKHMPADLRKDAYNLLSPPAKSFAATVPGFDVMSVKGLIDAVRNSKSFNEQSELISKIAAIGNDETFRALESLAQPESPLYDVLLGQLMRYKHADAKKYAMLALTSGSRGLASAALDRIKELFKEDPEDQNLYYGLLVCAARFPDSRLAALELLKKWAIDDKALAKLPAKPDEQIEYWEGIFHTAFKNDKRPFPALSGEGYQQPERFEKLKTYLAENSPAKTGNPAAGMQLFKQTAKCISCHAFKGEGTQLGPDLTDVVKRFDTAKIVEDIVYPSRVVDARYRQINFVLQDGRRLQGFVAKETDDTMTIVGSDATPIEIKKAIVTRKLVSDLSIMPNGLVDALTPEQIRDLLAYLQQQ